MQLDAMTTGEADNLCERCSAVDIERLLSEGRYQSLKVGPFAYSVDQETLLELGPYDYPIDLEKCDFCRIARQAVEYQDGHEGHIIRIKFSRVFGKAFNIEREYNGLPRGSRNITTSLCPCDFCARAIQERNDWRTRTQIRQGPTASYNTYDESVAVAQTLKWLRTCELNHPCSISTTRPKFPESSAFFVDVINNNIITAQAPDKYFALSYVCGRYDSIQLTVQNQCDLARIGALLDIDLPSTYRDAMSFTKMCGVRHLWIDFLCILHDNGKPNQRQIDAMDEIYGKATLVLIAALGTSASFGLYPKRIEAKKVKSVELHLRHGAYIEDDLKGNRYWSRSWCFQEKLLSSRKLYFGPQWLRFNCDGMNMMIGSNGSGLSVLKDLSRDDSFVQEEDTWAMQTIHRVAYNQERVNVDELFRAYDRIVQSFTQRELSYPNDIERAFAGIASVLGRIRGNEVLSGIPSVLLPHALLWIPCSGKSLVKRSSSVSYMSYSWTSCASGVFHPCLYEDCKPLISMSVPPCAKNTLNGRYLNFESSVVLANHFKIAREQVENEQKANVQVSRPLHFHCVCAGSNIRRGGRVLGITKGHEGCLDAGGAETGRYLIAALLSYDWGRQYGGLMIFQNGDVSIRVGVVCMEAAAFENFPSWREKIKLR